ncbi:MAG: DNA replication and repair protein RecF [Patescibacteria group bacterium]
MFLKSLHLQHFRNYDALDIDFANANITILTGKNGQGKSNFLEAVYLLALTKSFRTRKVENMVKWDRDFFRVIGKIAPAQSAPDDITLEKCVVNLPKKEKAFKKNDVKVKREAFIGHFQAVLFRPEDLIMLTGEPGLRRQYLNNIQIQTDPHALATLQSYHKAVQERNALLQGRSLLRDQHFDQDRNLETLDLWNQHIVTEGNKIQEFREKFISFAQSRIEKPYELHYAPKKNLQELLEKNLEKDLRLGVTTVGPHREDVKITFQGHDIHESASRGQLRRLMILLKKVEIEWMQRCSKQNPILLLDDIFSELDSENKAEIMQILPEAQVIMTIAEGNPLPEFNATLKAQSTVRRIHQGEIDSGAGVK